MPDGNNNELFDVLLDIKQQLGRMEGRLGDIVVHEKLAEKLNGARRETDTKIEASEDRISASFRAEVEKLKADIPERVRKVMRDEAGEADKIINRAKWVMWTGGGAGLVSFLYNASQAFGG